jgi:hypothetical protein
MASYENAAAAAATFLAGAVHTAYLGISMKKLDLSFYGLKLFLRS